MPKSHTMKFCCLMFIFSLSVIVCHAQMDGRFPEYNALRAYCANYALDPKPSLSANTNLIAIWKMQEDVDKHNYFVVERSDINKFVFTYMNREGSNRTYENVTAFFSKIGSADFVNVALFDYDAHRSTYFFLKVTDLDPNGWTMTLSLVADTTLKDLTSRQAVRDRIMKNMNKPGYFAKPVHFEKKLPLMYCK